MPAPGFGYSAGDFIATIGLIITVISAFKESGGASAEYRQVVQELDRLLLLLQHISAVKPTGNNFAHVNAIKGVALSIHGPLQGFLDEVTKRYGSLATGQQTAGSVHARLTTAGRKIQWAVFMEKDIAKLRANVESSLSSILLLLNINHMEAASFVEKLVRENQGALTQQRLEIQQGLASQRKTIDRYHLQQTNVINSVKTDIKDLASTTNDRLGIIERQQNRDSAALKNFLEFMKSVVVRLRDVLPCICELLYKMILSNLHLYTLLLGFQTTISQLPTMLLSDNIHFEDVLGRSRSLPFQYFRYWEVFQKFLECEFKSLPGEPNIRRGLYRILDAKYGDLIITETEWGRRVFPGSRLNMSVIIKGLRRKKGSCPVQLCRGESKPCGMSSVFLMCSICGMKYTDIPQSIQPKSTRSAAAKPLGNMRGDKRHGKRHGDFATQDNYNNQGGENKTNRLGQQRGRDGDIQKTEEEIWEREACEILNFKRIYISTLSDVKAKVSSEGNNIRVPTIKGRIRNTLANEERESIKDYWLSLDEEERRSLVKVEKEAALRKMKEPQKNSCSCSVCVRKRSAIEVELEVLYDAYYEQLEQYAHQQNPKHAAQDPHIPPLATSSAARMPLPPPSGPPPPNHHAHHEHHHQWHRVEESDDGHDFDEDDVLDEPLRENDPRLDFFNFGNSPTVRGCLVIVVQDLLLNDGKKFLEMMEQLAERRMQQEEEASVDVTGHTHSQPTEYDDGGDDEEDEEEYEGECDGDREDEPDTMTQEYSMEEGRRMFQIYAALMFEQRVLTAYREKMAMNLSREDN